MLRELRVSEMRYRAVLEVLDGAVISAVARRYGVSRQTVHAWLRRYAREGAVLKLEDRSSRPHGCPHQSIGLDGIEGRSESKGGIGHLKFTSVVLQRIWVDVRAVSRTPSGVLIRDGLLRPQCALDRGLAARVDEAGRNRRRIGRACWPDSWKCHG
jgi:Arc/MetJ family transcription regulator